MSTKIHKWKHGLYWFSIKKIVIAEKTNLQYGQIRNEVCYVQNLHPES